MPRRASGGPRRTAGPPRRLLWGWSGWSPGGGTRQAVIRHNIHVNSWTGILQVLSLNIAHPFFGIFAIKAGASNVQLALLSSLPAVVNVLALIPGGWFVDRFPRKKWITAWFLLASRLVFVFMALVPLVEPDRRAAMFVALVALMNLPGAVANIAWQSVIAGAIPPEQRGQALAYRQRLMGLATIAVTLVAGWGIDRMVWPVGYQVAFTLAFLLALGEVFAFTRLVEAHFDQAGGAAEAGAGGSGDTAAAAGTRPPGLRDIAAHPGFVRYTLASALFYFAWQMAWPLFTRYQVSMLGATNLWISVIAVCSTLSGVLTYGWWARQAGRRGSIRTLAVGVLGLSTVPLGYSFLPSLPVIAGFNLWTGIFGSGVVFLLLNALLEVVPAEHRTTYLAYYSTVTSLVGFLAPLFGVAIFEAWGLRAAFLVSFALRVAAAVGFFAVASAGARARRAAPAAAGGLPAPPR